MNARRDNGNVQYGCFATQNLSKGEGLVPALAFSGARISSEQVEALRISGDDARTSPYSRVRDLTGYGGEIHHNLEGGVHPLDRENA